MRNIKNGLNKIAVILGSRGFYRFIIGLFLFESIWIAFSALYPQAFDENFHFGLIKVYSHYWLPFLSRQPPNANAYGAVARDPSYLYHYLMSFPYRFLALFVHSQVAQVICLRLFDVGLFLIGLFLFRKVMKKVGLSDALINVCFLIFILIPIVPQLAAQISYDDLMFPLVAWTCLQAFNIIDDLKAHKPSSTRWFVLGITGLLSGIEKYAYLPIFLGVMLFLAYQIYQSYGRNLKGLLKELLEDFKKLSLVLRIALVAGFVIALGMFLQRDGVNIIEYHSVEPSCGKVLSVEQCKPYSAWYVHYARHETLISGGSSLQYNFFRYVGQWFYWMWYRLFFGVNGATSNFATKKPLPLPSIAAAYLAIIGGLFFLRLSKRIFKDNPYLVMLFTLSIVYCLTLFAQGYNSYKYTAVLENMNGRYLIPVLLPIAAVLGLAFSRGLRRVRLSKVLISILVIVLFLQGGGLLTFILDSDKTWYWDNKTIVKVNNEARKVAKHVVVKK